MKKFVFKSVLFLLPFILALAIELFILPIDFFTFRVWEALVAKKFHYILPGEFYPNMEVTKIEQGDLAPHTRFGYRGKTKWLTDQYGFRKQNTERKKHEIVIIGDSYIAGSALTQEDILSEVLEKKLTLSVYPLSPASLNSFLKKRRFKQYPPDIIIVSSVERFMSDLPPVKTSSDSLLAKLRSKIREIGYWLRNQVSGNRIVQFAGMHLDRLYKQNMLHYFRAALRRAGVSHSQETYSNTVLSKYGPVFFFQGAEANKDIPKGKFDKVVEVIKGYDQFLKRKGIRFIFLPIPEKENIYYEYLKTEKPVFLEKLISTLNNLGIEAVDTQTAFEDAFRRGVLLYHTNDTHWNENGVKIVAELLAKAIEGKGKILPRP